MARLLQTLNSDEFDVSSLGAESLRVSFNTAVILSELVFRRFSSEMGSFFLSSDPIASSAPFSTSTVSSIGLPIAAGDSFNIAPDAGSDFSLRSISFEIASVRDEQSTLFALSLGVFCVAVLRRVLV